jgi:succinate dehydrogenase / fumarate reductase membrane anchor subunit
MRLERLGWVFMRVSGVLLIGLIFTHLTVNLMQDGGVKAIDFAFKTAYVTTIFSTFYSTNIFPIKSAYITTNFATH